MADSTLVDIKTDVMFIILYTRGIYLCGFTKLKFLSWWLKQLRSQKNITWLKNVLPGTATVKLLI